MAGPAWMRAGVPGLAMALLLSAVATAADGLLGQGGWIREAPPVAPVRAGYIELVNAGGEDVVVTGADSPAFGAVEMHEMVGAADGTMRMRPVPRLTIPAGTTVELKPGGLHLMLFRPHGALPPGASVPLRLHTERGAVVEASLQVR